jgi:hypothetical protein
MTLNDLKEQFSSQAQDLLQKIQDSTIYQNLKEKYDDLPAGQQKIVAALTSLILIFFVFSIPFDNWSKSSESVHVFESQRDLINNLTTVTKETNETVVYAPAPPLGEIKTDMELKLQQYQLVAEQIGTLQVDLNSTEGLIPKSRQEGSLKVPLKKLNLRQMVDIVSDLQRVHPAVKLASFKVDSHIRDPRYLDIILDFIVIKIPQINLEPAAKENPNRRGRQ